MSFLIHHEQCPLCKGRPLPYLADTVDLHYGIEGRWDYQRCSDCRVVFLNPAPSEHFLSKVYGDSYYSYQEFAEPPAWKVWLKRILGFNVAATGDPQFAEQGRVLDIGCGSGQFLCRMKGAGWETHGVELSARAAEIGNTKHQLNIQTGTLATIKLPLQYFDYVRMNHSFEHLVDPNETLARVHGLLAPRGLLFIGVPNVDGLQARLFGKHWWNLGPPVHPFNYSKFTLTKLLEKHGFEVVSFRTNSNFAGILGSMQMVLNDRRGVCADTGRLFRNPVAKIVTHWLAKLSDMAKAGDCLEIVAQKRRT